MRVYRVCPALFCIALAGCASYQEHMATRWTPGGRMSDPDAAQMRPPSDPFVAHKSSDWTRYFPHLSRFAQNAGSQLASAGSSMRTRFSDTPSMHDHKHFEAESRPGSALPDPPMQEAGYDSYESDEVAASIDAGPASRRELPVLPVALVAEVAPNTTDRDSSQETPPPLAVAEVGRIQPRESQAPTVPSVDASATRVAAELDEVVQRPEINEPPAPVQVKVDEPLVAEPPATPIVESSPVVANVSVSDHFAELTAVFGHPGSGRNLIVDEPIEVADPAPVPVPVTQPVPKEQATDSVLSEPTIEIAAPPVAESSVPDAQVVTRPSEQPRLQDMPEADDPFAPIAGMSSEVAPTPASVPSANLEVPEIPSHMRSFRRVPRPLVSGVSGDLSGRPRVSLERAWDDGVSAELPPPVYPTSYYGPDEVAPPSRYGLDRVAPPTRPNSEIEHPKKEWRLGLPKLGLAKRWSEWREQRQREKSERAAQASDVAQGR